MKQKEMHKEEEKKEVPPAKDDGKEVPASPTPGEKDQAQAADGEKKEEASSGDDESSDLELLQKIISQAIGEEHKDDESVQSATKEAYEGYKEMGLAHEEASSKAGDALKLAKHRADKKAKEAASPDGEKKEETKESKCLKDEIPAMKSSGGSGGTSSLPPALKEANTKLIAENAALKEKIKKIELDSVLDSVCKESGLAVGVTKIFKEHVRALKLSDETKIKEKMKEFKEEFKAATGKEDNSSDSSSEGSPFHFVVASEKTSQGSGVMSSSESPFAM